MAAAAPNSGSLLVKSAPYGEVDGSAITQWTLLNTAVGGVEVRVIDYGAIITDVIQPSASGVKGNVVLGYDHLEAWVSGKPWINSLTGRYANRIAGGKFSIDGQTFQLGLNDKGNHLHGGSKAFGAKVMKSSEIKGSHPSLGAFVGVSMDFTSPDGDDSYPGALAVTTLFKLFADNTLQMEFLAHTTDGKATIVNLCNHAYWNLAGDEGKSTILDQTLLLNALSATEIDGKETIMTTGRIIPVTGNCLDFTTAHPIGEHMEMLNKHLPPPGGYDINYVLTKAHVDEPKEAYTASREVDQGLAASFAARMTDPATGRVMDVYTTAPGVQVYTGNFLDGESMVGRGGVKYQKHAAICLETQIFPDAINHAAKADSAFHAYPSGLLKAGEKYRHVVQHKFSTQEVAAKKAE